MSGTTEHINLIHSKLQLLLKQFEILQKENEKHVQSISNLEQELLQQKEHIESLHQQNLILKASVSDMDEADKKKLEQKIQGYIKNIDKCISHLSS